MRAQPFLLTYSALQHTWRIAAAKTKQAILVFWERILSIVIIGVKFWDDSVFILWWQNVELEGIKARKCTRTEGVLQPWIRTFQSTPDPFTSKIQFPKLQSPSTVLHVITRFPVSSISCSFLLYLGITAIFQPYSTKNHVQLTRPTPVLANHHFSDGLHAEGLKAKQALLTPWRTTSFLEIHFLFLFWLDIINDLRIIF